MAKATSLEQVTVPREARLRSFDEATARQESRNRGAARGEAAGAGPARSCTPDARRR